MDRPNPSHVYSMVGCDIEQTVEERDLGVLIDNQLKFHDHSSMAAGRARRLLGLISKCFINLHNSPDLLLFIQYYCKTNP